MSDITSCWEQACKEIFVIFWTQGNQLYFESPEEQGLDSFAPDYKEEGLVRAMLTLPEAEAYKEALGTYADINELGIAQMPLSDFFLQLEALRSGVVEALSYPIRAEISKISKGEFPRSVDVIWTDFEAVH